MTVAHHGEWTLRRGASVRADGVAFAVWAPHATGVSVRIADGPAAGDHQLRLRDDSRGTYELLVPGARAGDRYGFVLDGGDPLPDPASRAQPDGVHALSEVVDPTAFTWSDATWRGLPLADFVIYELHVGTFTPAGTFDAVIGRLAELRAMGITAIELMPVASFPGRRNWGYDGAHLYAPQASYGGPEALRRLVDAAHAQGLAVVLDVVYNHVGPEGNYLDRFGPYSTDAYRTPWGRAMNYDGAGSDEVRRWAHDNALYWVSEFHVDALRLDAVHGIYDFGALAFLEALSDEVHELGRRLGRKVQLMAESDLNDPRLIRPPQEGGYGMDAQWADDFHHTLHAVLTGECSGYYRSFRGVATMADVYREPFFYAGRYAPHRDRTHGRPSVGLPRQRFIVCSQNHDQVGNRPLGERLAALVPPDRQRLAAALVLLSPYIPLLLMGEEYGETAPFLYFIHHGDPALAESVREGRKREYDEIGRLEHQVDPQSEQTFERSRITWSQRDGAGAPLLSLYTDLLALRREEHVLRPGEGVTLLEQGDGWFTAMRRMLMRHDAFDEVRDQRAVWCAFNVSERTSQLPVDGDPAWGWRLRLSTDAEGYGGSGVATPVVHAAGTIPPVSDAPRRLIERPSASAESSRARVVTLAPWSAAVYVRDATGARAS